MSDPVPFILPDDAEILARSRGMLQPFAFPPESPPASGNGSHGDEQTDDWAPLDLNDPQWDEPAREPDLHQFIYSGLRHLVSGPPEATKTLIMYEAVIRLARDGKRCTIIDFEMGPRRAKLLLTELGAMPEQLALIQLICPESPPKGHLERVIAWQPALVLIDASLGAFQASGLDDNSRGDVEKYASIWVLPLWRAGISTAVIDHVSKNVESRAGWAIGSERKGGQVDVHIGLSVTAKRALTRGGKTTVEATVHKDRPGFLDRPHSHYIDIVSDEITHHLTVSYRIPEQMPVTERGGMRPTIKMDQVSKWLAKQTGPMSQAAIAEAIKGNREMCIVAINLLVDEGYLLEEPGPRGARLFTHVKPYARDTDPAEKHVPVAADNDDDEIDRLVRKYDDLLGA